MTEPEKPPRKGPQTPPQKGQKGGGSTVAAASQGGKAVQEKVGSPSGPAGGMVEVKVLPLAPTKNSALHLDKLEGAKPSCKKCYGTGRLGWQIGAGGQKTVVPCSCVIRHGKRLAAARFASPPFSLAGETKRSEKQMALLAPAVTLSQPFPSSFPTPNLAPVPLVSSSVEKRNPTAPESVTDGVKQNQSNPKG